jgi:predicted ArsR family transcriptional regulator
MPSKVRTRRALLDLLKREGPMDSSRLASRLGVSAMAVRQHLYVLKVQKLVTYEEESRPLGRPAKLWRLTGEASRLFPDAHAELTVGLIGAVRDAFGRKGMARLLSARARSQIEAYRKRIPVRGTLASRVRALARLRTEEGYMAEVQAQTDRVFLLVENHCPVCAAATVCQGLCGAELEVFRGALGSRVTVERTEHLLQGSRRCVYRVRSR